MTESASIEVGIYIFIVITITPHLPISSWTSTSMSQTHQPSFNHQKYLHQIRYNQNNPTKPTSSLHSSSWTSTSMPRPHQPSFKYRHLHQIRYNQNNPTKQTLSHQHMVVDNVPAPIPDTSKDEEFARALQEEEIVS